MFRDAVAAQTPLGRKVGPILERGELVPDELTVQLIGERLSAPDAAEGFVLDGFPRNLRQASELDELLAGLGERLERRAKQEKRTDDTPEAIQRRLRIYHEETEPVIEHYRVTGSLVPLHAAREIGEVWAETQA